MARTLLIAVVLGGRVGVRLEDEPRRIMLSGVQRLRSSVQVIIVELGSRDCNDGKFGVEF